MSALSYVDLARSHVKECLREAFCLEELVVDDDGDVPFVWGTALYFVTVSTDGQMVKVWAHAVLGLKVTPAVLREVNEVNRGLLLTRAYTRRKRLVVEGVLPVDGLTVDGLLELCREVGTTADEVGQMVSAVHGGEVLRPDGGQGRGQCRCQAR